MTQIQQTGSMTFVHVVKSATEHFERHVPEWLMAWFIVLWGANLLDPFVSFDVALPAWRGMTAIPFLHDAKSWGWFTLSIGLVRVLALFINGRLGGTPYATLTPRMRSLTALAGATAWFVVATSVGQAPTPGRITYVLPLVMDVWCVFYAARDTGRVQQKATRDAQL
jgi:hypothetical protein